MAGAEPSQTSDFPDFSDRLFSDPAIKEIQHRMDVLWQDYPDLKKVVDNKKRKKTLTRAPIANKEYNAITNSHRKHLKELPIRVN